MNLAINELAQVGFALHIEASAYPRELVRPEPCPVQRVFPDLPLVEKAGHSGSLQTVGLAPCFISHWPVSMDLMFRAVTIAAPPP